MSGLVTLWVVTSETSLGGSVCVGCGLGGEHPEEVLCSLRLCGLPVCMELGSWSEVSHAQLALWVEWAMQGSEWLVLRGGDAALRADGPQQSGGDH